MTERAGTPRPRRAVNPRRGGPALAVERLEAGVTQAAVAAALGIPGPALSFIEQGVLPLPRGWVAKYRAALAEAKEER